MEKNPIVFVGPRPRYSVDALPKLTFNYDGEGVSATGEMEVNRFWTDGSVLRKDVLCTLTSHTLLGIVKTLNSEGISFSSPGLPVIPKVNANVSAQ